MKNIGLTKFKLTAIALKIKLAGLALSLFLLGIARPAAAHHALGGRTPANFGEGFLSGLAHPVIGVDHLAFVVAVGLLAALKPRGGVWIPVAFIFATLTGTGIHLLSLDLPATEMAIAASVLVVGVMLAKAESPPLFWCLGLAAAAGIFHGYAYGEAIVGAPMTPLGAYLAGFAAIQLVIALIARQIGRLILKNWSDRPSLNFRFAGFTITGVGAAFLGSAIFG